MYAKYFTLKDYDTSDGANSKEYYDDLQEFITGCNNIIREK
ncbi:hypothetical protein [Butyrivibrio fibrisolvens]|nr:hypothetical protein [Butyrivibrio fibrisolvens]